MGRLDRWFDETDWPRDPRLDAVRDAVWRLSLDGEVRGWLTTAVEPMRSFPLLWVKQERMWSQIHWADGGHEYLEEDYGPEWHSVRELLSGRFSAPDPRVGRDVMFDATPVPGAERDRLWAQLDHGVAPHGRR